MSRPDNLGQERIADGTLVPLGYQQISLGAGVASLTVPAGARIVLIQNGESAGARVIRWRDDGTNPTVAIGMRILAQAELYYTGNLAAFRMIRESAAAQEVNISYYS